MRVQYGVRGGLWVGHARGPYFGKEPAMTDGRRKGWRISAGLWNDAEGVEGCVTVAVADASSDGFRLPRGVVDALERSHKSG